MSLFDLLDGPGAARAVDPDTSKVAAEVPGLSQQRHAVLAALEAVERFNPHRVGATAHEVMLRMAFGGHAPQQNVVARRISDLRDRGLVEDSKQRRPGASSAPLTCWTVTAAGRELLESL